MCHNAVRRLLRLRRCRARLVQGGAKLCPISSHRPRTKSALDFQPHILPFFLFCGLTDLNVHVPDEVVSEVVAHIHLGNFSELAELLENLLEEVFELAPGEAATGTTAEVG